MVQNISGERGAVRADLLLALSGFAVLVVAFLMIQLRVPVTAAIGVELIISSICLFRWVSFRRSVMTTATV